MSQRERDGHSLSKSMFSFKLSPLLIHPLVHRPTHYSTYLCTFQNPGEWVGPSLITITLPNYLPQFGKILGKVGNFLGLSTCIQLIFMVNRL